MKITNHATPVILTICIFATIHCYGRERITPSDMQVIGRSFRQHFGANAKEGLGYITVTETGKYIKITTDNTPLLAEPSVGLDQLQIAGLAARGECFKVLKTEVSLPSLDFFNPRPSSEGTWYRVRGRNGDEGWIHESVATLFEVAPPPPPQPPAIHPKAATNGVIFVLVVFAGATLVIVGLKIIRHYSDSKIV